MRKQIDAESWRGGGASTGVARFSISVGGIGIGEPCRSRDALLWGDAQNYKKAWIIVCRQEVYLTAIADGQQFSRPVA